MSQTATPRTNSLDFVTQERNGANIQAVGKSLSSDLKLGYSGARTHKPSTTTTQGGYAERYEMSHRPASLPDFAQASQQANNTTGFGIEHHFGGTVKPTPAAAPPKPQVQRRHVSPTKSAPTSASTTNNNNQDRSDFLEPLKKPKSEIETAINRLNQPTKTHWEELIGALDIGRRLAAHHPDVIGPRAGEVASLIIRQCANGRSKVV